MTEKSTSMSTVCRLIIKELRLERGLHQAHIASAMGKSASAWSKTEAGDTPLTLDHFFAACYALNVWPTAVLTTVQNYVSLLNFNGWFVSPHGFATEKTDDALWIASDEFYLSANTILKPASVVSVLNTPWPYQNAYVPLRVFDYAITKNFSVMGVENGQLK